MKAHESCKDQGSPLLTSKVSFKGRADLLSSEIYAADPGNYPNSNRSEVVNSTAPSSSLVLPVSTPLELNVIGSSTMFFACKIRDGKVTGFTESCWIASTVSSPGTYSPDNVPKRNMIRTAPGRAALLAAFILASSTPHRHVSCSKA